MNRLRELLETATVEEMNLLGTVLGCNPDLEAIVTEISRACRGFWGSVLQKEYSFREVVSRVAKHLGVAHDPSGEEREIEIAIVKSLCAEALSKMTADERKDLDIKLLELTNRPEWVAIGGGVLTGSSALFLSTGFAPYLLSSTLIGAATKFIGITLPFGFYTGLSGLMATAAPFALFMGIGMLLAGICPSPDFQKLAVTILVIHQIRSRKEMESRLLRFRRRRLLKKCVYWLVVTAAAAVTFFLSAYLVIWILS